MSGRGFIKISYWQDQAQQGYLSSHRKWFSVYVGAVVLPQQVADPARRRVFNQLITCHTANAIMSRICKQNKML